MEQFKDGLAFAKKLDMADPLKEIKSRFYIQEGTLYMDGNSLGLCSKDAEKCLLKAIEDWKKHGIELWTHGDCNYFSYQDTLGELFAPLINADPDEVTVTNSTTINIHQAMATFYQPVGKKNKVVIDELNFPTDRYAVTSQIKLKGLDPDECLKVVKSRDGKTLSHEDIIEAMTEDVCLIMLPSVLYRSAQLMDMERIASEAHKRGIVVGFDLCHSIGSVPHDFKKINPDFAVWCTYKYISGGPGSIAGLFINRKHFAKGPGLAGWHGNRKDTQFDLNQEFEHAHYAGGWQTGTQPIFSMAPVEGSLRLFNEIGMEKIREKSLKATAYMMYLIDMKLAKYGFTIGNPREDAGRGGHVALQHEDAIRISEAIKARRIIPDFRKPNVIRLAPIALYTSYEDVYEMVERFIAVMENKEYEDFKNERGTVA